MAKKAGESSAALVVALVFSVIVNIGLGVAVYYGFAEQENLNNAKKKAEGEKKTADDLKDWYKFQALYYRSALGQLPLDKQEELTSLRGRFDSGAFNSVAD